MAANVSTVGKAVVSTDDESYATFIAANYEPHPTNVTANDTTVKATDLAAFTVSESPTNVAAVRATDLATYSVPDSPTNFAAVRATDLAAQSPADLTAESPTNLATLKETVGSIFSANEAAYITYESADVASIAAADTAAL